MKHFACRYAIVQFLPHTETGEFANVGIVLACPETGYFHFKLQTRRYARITGFFEELSKDVYLTAIKTMQTELERIQHLVLSLPTNTARADTVRNLMAALTHPREAIVRFGAMRPILTPDPAAQLDQLFKHYVDRVFATHEYVEQTITRRIQTLLEGLTLPAPFKKERVGDEQVHASFPLVQRLDGQIAKVIKPFNLAHNEANDIYEHGDAWLQKVRRLRHHRWLPDHVLFAVEAPPPADPQRFAAYQEISGELQQQGVQLVQKDQEPTILAFATAAG